MRVDFALDLFLLLFFLVVVPAIGVVVCGSKSGCVR
jgi:hypothetical protein